MVRLPVGVPPLAGSRFIWVGRTYQTEEKTSTAWLVAPDDLADPRAIQADKLADVP